MNDTPTDFAQTAFDEQQKRKRRRRIGCWAMGCGAPTGLLLLVGVCVLIWQYNEHSRTTALKAEIHARGEPLNREQIDSYFFAEPNEEIGADALYETCGWLFDYRMKRYGELEGLPLVGGGPKPPPEYASEWPEHDAVRAFFAAKEGRFQELEEAALQSRNIHYRDSVDSTIYHVSVMENAHIFLSLKALSQARDGQADATFRTLRAMFAMTRALRSDPEPSAQLQRRTSRKVAQNEIRQFLPELSWTDEQLKLLIEDCLEPDWSDVALRTMVYERAHSASVFQDPNDSMRRDAPYFVPAGDECFCLMKMTEVVEAAKLPMNEMLPRWTAIGEDVPDSMMTPFLLPISCRLWIAINQVGYEFGYGRTQDQATAALIAIELYQRKHGQPPESLEDLVPEFLENVPTGSYTKDPLKYQVTDDEIVVYSLGYNMVDDGGDDNEHLDFVFSMRR